MKQAGLVAGLGLLFSYLLSLIPAAGWVFSIVGLVLAKHSNGSKKDI
jgi:uncharacterized BrkB/YihY/UPF0761 family membrane protein